MADICCKEPLRQENEQYLNKIVTKAEMAVLEVMYENNGPMTMIEIQATCNKKNNTNWKPQTVSTFLRRLCTKGMTTMERDGHTFKHKTVLPYEKFVSNLSQDFLMTWFNNNLSKFFDIYIKNVRPLTQTEKNAIFELITDREV